MGGKSTSNQVDQFYLTYSQMTFCGAKISVETEHWFLGEVVQGRRFGSVHTEGLRPWRERDGAQCGGSFVRANGGAQGQDGVSFFFF
jgi:hypothetical protein